MAKWRSVELESLVGGPLDEVGLTEAALQRMITSGALEGEQLDFKSRVPASGNSQEGRWSASQEFAKDVAAFANHRGGLLLFGVRESDGVATGLAAISDGSFESQEQRLRQVLATNQAPTALIECFMIPAEEGGFYMAVVVPPSFRAPHAITGHPGDSRRPLYYPVRNGADTVWLSESEVAESYRRRVDGRAAAESLTTSLLARGQEALARRGGYWVFVSAIPELRVDTALRQDVIKEIEAWQRLGALALPSGRYLPTHGAGIPVPGGVSFTQAATTTRTDETVPNGAYLELHADGTVFAAAFLADHAPAGADVSEYLLVQDLILLVDQTLRWVVHRSGAWGVATLVTGIHDASGTGANDWYDGLSLTDRRRGDQVPRTRTLRSQPKSEVAADLGQASDQQGRFAIAHYVASTLLQWFGVAEPDLIGVDGTIFTRRWEVDRHDLARWAVNQGVSTDETY